MIHKDGGDCVTALKCVVWRRYSRIPIRLLRLPGRCLALFCQVPLALSASSHFAEQTSQLTGTTEVASRQPYVLRIVAKHLNL